MIKLVEIVADESVSWRSGEQSDGKVKYFLREIFVNPENVIYFVEDEIMKRKLTSGLLNLNIDSRQGFTKLSLRMGKDITIVGPPSTISEKLRTNKGNLLKG